MGIIPADPEYERARDCRITPNESLIPVSPGFEGSVRQRYCEVQMRQIVDRLDRETFDVAGHTSTYLAGSFDFGGHSDVTFVIHPPFGTPLTDSAMLDTADEKCAALVTRLDEILRSATGPIGEMLRETYLRDSVPPDEFLFGLRLTHVKVMFEQGDELILTGNPHYDGHDLTLQVNSEYHVSEASLDG